jgi:hypothetical protein
MRWKFKLKKEILSFAYPNGSADDFEAVIQEVRSAGYIRHVQQYFGINNESTDPFALRRRIVL